MATIASSNTGGHYDTRKSHKSKTRDRPSHSLRPGATDGPRKGGGGKGNWGRAGDEVKIAAESRHDPNYDPEEHDDDDHDTSVALQPAATEKKRFSEGAADLTKYKRAVKDAADEYLISGDLAVFVSIIKKETRAVFGQELPVILIRLALDKAAPLRAQLFALPKHILEQGIINKVQVLHSFRKLFNILDDLIVDAPAAEKFIVEALQLSVVDGTITRVDADALLTARRSLANVDAVRAAKLRIKAIVDSYYNSGDSNDVRVSLTELKAPHLHFEVVKQLIQIAFDRRDAQREMASVAIAELADLLSEEEIAKAFTILLTRVEDLYLDVPDILHLLSSFLARAIRDEALPPAFLLRVDLPAGDNSNQVVSQANKLVSAKGSSVRLGRVWGTKDDNDINGTRTAANGSSSSSNANNGNDDDATRAAHRNAMRRLRAKKRAAAAKGIDPASITLGASPSSSSSSSSSSARAPKKEQKLKVAQIPQAKSPSSSSSSVGSVTSATTPKSEVKQTIKVDSKPVGVKAAVVTPVVTATSASVGVASASVAAPKVGASKANGKKPKK